MKMQRLILALFLLVTIVGCGTFQTKSKLLRVWSAPVQDVPIAERAAAVNRYFKQGTPVTSVVKVLGSNYIKFAPTTRITGVIDAVPQKASGLLYYFGNDFILIQTTAPLDADPLTGKFTKAGYSAP